MDLSLALLPERPAYVLVGPDDLRHAAIAGDKGWGAAGPAK